MSAPLDKLALKSELVRLVTADVETLERAQRSAVEAATHEEAKPENDKDTRALEASYLARGHALRLEELRSALAELVAWSPRALLADAPVALGALVRAGADDAEHLYFIAPHGGGLKLGGGSVQVVTPRSPLGRALVGKRIDDETEIVVEGRKRDLAILSVS